MKEKNQKHFNKTLCNIFVQDREELNINEKMILSVLIRYSDDDGHCYCSYNQIKKKCTFGSYSTVSKYLNLLEEKQLIRIIKTTSNGQKHSNQFDLKFWKSFLYLNMEDVLGFEGTPLDVVLDSLGTPRGVVGTPPNVVGTPPGVDKENELKRKKQEKEFVVVYEQKFNKIEDYEKAILINELDTRIEEDLLIKVINEINPLTIKTTPIAYLVGIVNKLVENKITTLDDYIKSKTKEPKKSNSKVVQYKPKNNTFDNFDDTVVQYGDLDDFDSRFKDNKKGTTPPTKVNSSNL